MNANYLLHATKITNSARDIFKARFHCLLYSFPQGMGHCFVDGREGW